MLEVAPNAEVLLITADVSDEKAVEVRMIISNNYIETQYLYTVLLSIFPKLSIEEN